MKAVRALFCAAATTLPAAAGQAPGAATKPDVPISHHDRFYTADQFSNTVSVIDPADNRLLGVIRLGEPFSGNFNPNFLVIASGNWASAYKSSTPIESTQSAFETRPHVETTPAPVQPGYDGVLIR